MDCAQEGKPMRRRQFITLIGGAAAAWPFAARAQQQSHPTRIGFLPLGSPSSNSDLSLVEALRKGVRDGGLLEGRDVILDVVWTRDGREYPEEVIELIQQGVEVLVTAGSSASSAAKHQTSTIPIVFINVGNPIGIGLVESLNRPGGNVTGFADAVADLSGKFVDIARELGGSQVPIDYLWHTAWEDGRHRFSLTGQAAQAAGMTLRSRPLNDIDDLEPQLAAMKSDGATTVIIQAGPFAHRYRKRIIQGATSAGCATIYGFPPVAHDGALIAYGPDAMEMYHAAGQYSARIVKGEKPADLPVQQPTHFQLVINLATAKALGLKLPTTLLARADEVIE
jgi:putative tryptophan/tyrosine transport system substrate-binding protein